MAKQKESKAEVETTVKSMVEKVMSEVPVSDLTEVLVIGYHPSGKISINASRPRYDFVHWLLNKAMVEIVLLEKEHEASRTVEVVSEAEEKSGD